MHEIIIVEKSVFMKLERDHGNGFEYASVVNGGSYVRIVEALKKMLI